MSMQRTQSDSDLIRRGSANALTPCGSANALTPCGSTTAGHFDIPDGTNLKYNLTVRDREPERIVKSCCFEMNGRYVGWTAQLAISVIIIGFSCVQLALVPSASINASSVYCSLLSAVVSYWLPSPNKTLIEE